VFAVADVRLDEGLLLGLICHPTARAVEAVLVDRALGPRAGLGRRGSVSQPAEPVHRGGRGSARGRSRFRRTVEGRLDQGAQQAPTPARYK
jgi:hypothetical protein